MVLLVQITDLDDEALKMASDTFNLMTNHTTLVKINRKIAKDVEYAKLILLIYYNIKTGHEYAASALELHIDKSYSSIRNFLMKLKELQIVRERAFSKGQHRYRLYTTNHLEDSTKEIWDGFLKTAKEKLKN